MTNKIDWNKPIETSYYEGAWKPARLVCKNRKCDKIDGVDYNHLVLYSTGVRDHESATYFTEGGKCFSSSVKVRNVPEKPKATQHVILTYRTASGKLSSTVKGMDFLNNGKKWSVGDYLNDNKVLHITEFELVA